MKCKVVGSGREVDGEWMGNGWGVDGEWMGSGWEMDGGWIGNGWMRKVLVLVIFMCKLCEKLQINPFCSEKR
jgi:hypothetical protein